MDPIRTHVRLNSDRFATYELLRAEVIQYAARIEEDASATYMDVDQIGALGCKGKKGKGK